MTAKNILVFVLCLAICFVPALVGNRLGPGPWYAGLHKSALTPPGYVFLVVWGVLYLLMGVALFLLWLREGVTGSPMAVLLFAVQLAINAMWFFIFFGRHQSGLAFVELLCLWVFVAATALSFWRVHRAAAVLLLPYLAWVTFAGYLNFVIWRMNA